MNAAPRSGSARRVRLLLALSALLAVLAAAAVPLPTAAQTADPPVDAAQVGSLTYIPLAGAAPAPPAEVTAWLRPSANQINAGSYFSLTVLAESTSGDPEPFVNVLLSYNAALVDFQSATTVPGDFVSTQPYGLNVQFNGPLATGQERYATLVFKARAGITNTDVVFGGSFNAAGNVAGSLPTVTILIGTGTIHPSVRYACEFGRGGSGPLGQNPGAGNNPFGTTYFFGAFRRDNGGCGFTFSPGARVSYWVAQPTGPSVPLDVFGNADSAGEVEIQYNTTPLAQVCPVNLCAFAMNASADNNYVLVAPFNLARPGAQSPADAIAATVDAAASTAPAAIEAADIVAPAQVGLPAQLGRGGLGGVVTAATGDPLENVLVSVTDPASERVLRTALTDDSGRYLIPSGLPSGTYQVLFTTSWGHNLENVDYVDQALSVAIAAPATAALDAQLALGATISGRVAAAESGAGLREVLVLVYDATRSNIVSAAVTSANGRYTTDALPSGDYVVQFEPAASDYDASRGYVGEFHEDQALSAQPVPVGVAAPAPETGVDGTLARCATCGGIEGQLTADDTDEPLADATVVIRNAADGRQVAVETTDEDGRYHVVLPSGDYTVEYFNDFSQSDVTRAYLDGFLDPAAGATVQPDDVSSAAPPLLRVQAPKVSLLDVLLGRGVQYAGTVTTADTGKPLADVQVVVRDPRLPPRQDVVAMLFTDANGNYISPALTSGKGLQFEFRTANSRLLDTQRYIPDKLLVNSPIRKGVVDDQDIALRRQATPQP